MAQNSVRESKACKLNSTQNILLRCFFLNLWQPSYPYTAKWLELKCGTRSFYSILMCMYSGPPFIKHSYHNGKPHSEVCAPLPSWCIGVVMYCLGAVLWWWCTAWVLYCGGNVLLGCCMWWWCRAWVVSCGGDVLLGWCLVVVMYCLGGVLWWWYTAWVVYCGGDVRRGWCIVVIMELLGRCTDVCFLILLCGEGNLWK